MTDNVDRLIQAALTHDVDPVVALALASGEGGLSTPALDGDIGYGYGKGVPTSFGPFQLHWKGAMPRRYWGHVSESRNFANSQEGIDYALGLIAGSGATRSHPYRVAIANAVRYFERPAKPQPEIDRDIAWYQRHEAEYRRRIPSVHPKPAFPAFPGDMGPEQGNKPSIALLQTELTTNGFYHGPVNGIWNRDVSDAVISLKETHDVLMFLGGHSDLAEYWGVYHAGKGKWDDRVGERTWSFLAWLDAVRKAKA